MKELKGFISENFNAQKYFKDKIFTYDYLSVFKGKNIMYFIFDI